MCALNTRVSLSRRNNSNALVRGGGTSPDANPSATSETRVILEARVQKIMRMIEDEPVRTIRDLALEINVSPSHLQRLFKHQTGISMGEWLCEQRLQRAAHLLTKSYLSVKEIAHTVGYEHPSSFIRAFERRFTQAPARFRKQSNCTKS